MHYKHSGYSTVSPYLIISDASATIRFLEAVFGAKPIRSFPDLTGRLMHAEVQLGDTVRVLPVRLHELFSRVRYRGGFPQR